jgi:hypothetical protein
MTTAAPKTLGLPERWRSAKPSMPSLLKRLRQRCTTCGLVPSRSAISLLATPSAAISTTLARTTCQNGKV